VVGTKIDLDSKRKISKFEAQEIVEQYNLPYFEVSAKSGENVTESFMFLTMIRMEMIQKSVSKGDIKEFIKYFEDENIDVNRKSIEFKETPLFIACKNGRLEIVEYMLASQRELDILSKNYKGILPLEIAKINSELQEIFSHEKNDDEVQQRQNNCLSIYNLLQEYQSNPKKVKRQLRKKLNLKGINMILFLY